MWRYYQIMITKEHKKQLEKQEKWRQKQLDIFYRTGKPIFTMTLDNMYMRSKNNPFYFIDYNHR